MSQELEGAVYHEAGHAVAHWYFSHQIESVTIKPEIDSHGDVISVGKVNVKRPPDIVKAHEEHEMLTAEQRQFEDENIVAVYAGRCAEARHDNHEGLDAAAYAYAEARARQLVDARWELIEAVAAALLERETLSGSELGEVLDEAHGLAS